MTHSYAIGIDLGGTKIAMALIDKAGQVSENLVMPTQVIKGYQSIEDDIFNAIQVLQKKAMGPVFGIGIGVPGQIDFLTGAVRFAPNLHWENVPLLENLKKRCHLPVAITNDVRAATWGEWLHGAGKNSKNIACLFVGTGIGSGIVMNGQMLNGFTNSAGEWGHTVTLMNGPLCTCGNHGCLEALASGWAITKRAKQRILENPRLGKRILEKAAGDLSEVTTKMVIEAFHENDLLAKELISYALDALTMGCISLINAINPERLVLGGGVLTGLPEAPSIIKQGIRKYALKAASAGIEILPAQLTHDAGTVGAGTLAWKTLLNSTQSK